MVDQTPNPDPETARRLAAWDKGRAIRWLRQTEPNASRARNTGALAATGDILLFIDDDVRLGKDFLAVYANSFADLNVIGVAGQILEGQGKTTTTLLAKSADREVGWLYFRKNFGLPCETNWVASGNFVLERQLLAPVA